MARVFISHSSKDGEVAERLKNELAKAGFDNIFLDFDEGEGVWPGENWERRLYSEIQRAQAIVLVLTPNWLASNWCFAEFTQARALGKSIFPVIFSPIGDQFFASDIQSIDITHEFEGGFERLRRSLTEVALNTQGGFQWDGTRSPFPGMLSFAEEDAAIFFGRDDDIRRIIERLNARRAQGGPRIQLLLAASGAGKSSVLHAGVIPRLRRDSSNWILLGPVRPETRPVRNLIRQIAVELSDGERSRLLRDRLQEVGTEEFFDDLVEEVRHKRRAPAAHLLVIVDPVEELFTVADEREREAFLELLTEVSSADLPIIFLMAMRSDFLDQWQASPAIGSLDEELSLKPLPIEKVGEIIRGPALVAGLEVEDALIAAAMRDAQSPDALPLLAFSLRTLHEQLGSVTTLTLAAYEALGDRARGLTPIENAVREAADTAVADARLSEIDLDALRRAFVPNLVRIDQDGNFVRRAARLESLPAQSRPALERLIKARVLTVRREDNADWIEVTHEAVLRKWPLLRGWIEQEQEFLLGRERIVQAMSDWKIADAEDKPAALLHGLMLDRARVWNAEFGDSLGVDERAFIEASAEAADRAQRKRNRLRNALTFGGISAGVVFAALSVIALFQWQAAEESRRLSDRNLGLALLTEAEALLVAERPTRAHITSALALGELPMAGRSASGSPLAPGSDSYLRARAIHRITGPATMVDERVLQIGTGATSIAWGADRQTLAVATEDVEVRVFDPTRDILKARISGHDRFIGAIDFSPDGRWLASASSDSTVGLWTAGTDEAARLCGHEAPVRDVAFHPSRPILASASLDRSVRVWNAESAKSVEVFDQLSGYGQTVRFSPDGNWLGYADQSGAIYLRRTSDWKLIRRVETQINGIVSISFDPRSERLAAIGVGGEVLLLPLTKDASTQILHGPQERSWNIVFTPDGMWLATSSWSGNINFWNTETGRFVVSADIHEHWVRQLAISEDGTRATASYDGTVRMSPGRTPLPIFESVQGDQFEALTADFDKKGDLLAVGGRDAAAKVFLRDDRGWFRQQCSTGPHAGWIWALAIHPDGTLFATAGNEDGAESNQIRLWHTIDCAPAGSLDIAKRNVRNLLFTLDGRYLLAALDKDIGRWSTDGWRRHDDLKGHKGRVWDLATDSTGSVVASAGEDGQVRVWDAGTGAANGAWRLGDGGPIWQVAFQPGTARLFAGGLSKSIYAVDWRTGNPVTLNVKAPSNVSRLKFTPSGDRLFVGDETRSTTVWRTDAWEREAILSASVGVRGPFSIDSVGRFLAYDGEDGLVRLLELARLGASPGSRSPALPAFELNGSRIRLNPELPPGSPDRFVAASAPMRDVHLPACR
ncbi:TIR domain-containing protein [Minwuia thermotolerans]|uniref:nSTAND1 domain-containing NTPase n=1 Tax=Minwuia thermotolerans TaxID=2056226 RepID=UPI0013DE1D21|nr:TIR domain-containing protein [Minwuia thermotolerans]